MLFQVIDETLDVKEMIFNAERVGGLEAEPVRAQLQNLTARFLVALGCFSPSSFHVGNREMSGVPSDWGPHPHFSVLLDKRAEPRISMETGRVGVLSMGLVNREAGS